MQLIDFLSLSSLALVYFNKDRNFLFGNLKQNVPLSPPTLLALSADGYNLISASPAGLMWEKQYLRKLIFNLFSVVFGFIYLLPLFFWSREGRGWEWCGKRERESARAHSHFLGHFFSSLQSDGQKSQYNSTNRLLWRLESIPSLQVFCVILILPQWLISCSMPMILGL